MSLIEKIDAEIERLEKSQLPRWVHPELHDETKAAINEAYLIRKIILSEQKEPCEGCLHDTDTERDNSDYCDLCKRAYTDEYEAISINHTQNDTVTVD